jgi:hypothetical protein
MRISRLIMPPRGRIVQQVLVKISHSFNFTLTEACYNVRNSTAIQLNRFIHIQGILLDQAAA